MMTTTALAALLAAGIAGPAAAQNAPAAENAAADEAAPNEIVVTATKRATTIQDVPLSITAITSEQIEQRGIEDFSDYARGVPALSFQSNRPGQTRIALRGIPNLGIGATVSVYIDETPITTDDNRTGASDPAVLDMERIEVLRGPQGTLYGSSSMGGTIRLITNKPDPTKFEGNVSATTSVTEHGGLNYGANAVVNLPLVQDKVALRLAGMYRSWEGFVDRVAVPQVAAITGLTAQQRADYLAGDENINDVEISSFRASLLANLTDDFSVLLSAFATRNDHDNQPTIDSAFGGRYVNTLILDEPALDRNNQYNLTAKYDFGGAELTSSTSYVDRKGGGKSDVIRQTAADFGNSPAGTFDFGTDVGIFTQEVRLASQGENRIDYVVGAFYWEFDETTFSDQTLTGLSALTGQRIPGDLIFHKDATRDYHEKALFGELTFNATDALHFIVGARAYRGKQAFSDTNSGLRGAARDGSPSVTGGAAKYDGINPKVQVSYDITDDVMAYATASRGYRAGGGNQRLPSNCAADLAALGRTEGPAGYESDKLWNYEVGAKTSWLDKRLTLNGALFYIDWTNIQVRQNLSRCGFSFLTNGGKASSQGFELEVAAHPTDALEFNLGVGYADTDMEATPNFRGRPNGDIPGVPDLSFNAGATYTVPLGSSLEGALTATYQYTAAFRDGPLAPSPINYRSDVNAVNLRAEIYGNGWNAGLFVENALNELAVVGANQVGPTTVQWAVNRPRTFGIRAGFDF